MFSYTKEEHFACHQTRMCTKSHVRLGVNREGLATAIEMTQYADAGVCASTQETCYLWARPVCPFCARRITSGTRVLW